MSGCIAQHLIYKNYGARENGTVINLKYWRILKPSKCKGYLKITPCVNSKQKQILLHRFVYECFKEYIPAGFEIDHIDNNKHNNHIDNLQLLTHKENCTKSTAVSIVSICIKTGEKNFFISMSEAAKVLELDVSNISKIVKKQRNRIKSKKTGLWYTFEKA